ncbi:hypothetical protein [Amycolatopsis sp. FDAARGOS 1241]|uniref:hypothetical protein n=1 Tax=Amycolatopsis sp. FDAARGOS 1241 TaxID=2778070 RepID=UPI00194E3515|nr:hypothetical protein [Amycolatopsis sp. FDAARGOS 1241]QRP46404.1 hypothetical protein I6J71_46630 [Amycolatopsis sp. FDAARGOS 1241]
MSTFVAGVEVAFGLGAGIGSVLGAGVGVVSIFGAGVGVEVGLASEVVAGSDFAEVSAFVPLAVFGAGFGEAVWVADAAVGETMVFGAGGIAAGVLRGVTVGPSPLVLGLAEMFAPGPDVALTPPTLPATGGGTDLAGVGPAVAAGTLLAPVSVFKDELAF